LADLRKLRDCLTTSAAHLANSHPVAAPGTDRIGSLNAATGRDPNVRPPG
jgi:hypothetical protein